jgi:L-2,4-diaminobutyrate decarboxylase
VIKREAEDWIQLCYDPRFAQRCGEKLTMLFAEHLERLQTKEKNVQDWVTPGANVALASEFFVKSSFNGSETQQSLTDLSGHCLARFAELVALCLEKSQGLHHPLCAGHQVPAVPPLAAWFDALTSLTNQVQGVYEMGPWSVSVERAMLNAVGEEIGFTAGEFGSLVTSGGSLANLTALLAARKSRFPEVWRQGFSGVNAAPVVVVHQDAHYCIDRAVGVMGIGTEHLVRVPVDEQRRMKVLCLEEILLDLKRREVPVLAVVSVAGSTACGAFDSLRDVSRVCRKFDVWLHVDAAHGGGLKFSKRYKDRVDGLELADSVVVDAHKMLFVPAVCALLFFKDPSHQFIAFDQEAPYLFDPSEPSLASYDNAVVTLECTKRASAIGMWGVWSIFGPQFFEAMIDRVLEIARQFYLMLKDAEGIEVWGEPSCNIVLFRCIVDQGSSSGFSDGNDFQLLIRRRLLETGVGYLTQTKLNDKIYLRTTIMNPMINQEDLLQMLQEVRRAATAVAANQ